MSIYKGNKLVAGGSIDTHFVRKPAWDQAVAVSVASILSKYKVPADGMIVGLLFTNDATSTGVSIHVNGVEIARNKAKDSDRILNVQCLVSKDDVITITGDDAGINKTSSTIRFVPFEASTVSESDVEVVTPELIRNLIRNLQSPDWSKAVKLNVTELYSEGYNVPSNGIIVGYFVSNPAASAYLNINNITVARSTLPPDSTTATTGSDSNVQCPVNKGDHITLEPNNTAEVYKLAGGLNFVPYKAQ